MSYEVPEEFPELRKLLVAHQRSDECTACQSRWEKIKKEAQRIWAEGWADGYGQA